MAPSSWLCDETGRRRLIENNSRVRPQRIATFALLLVVLTVTGPWVGWWPLAPLAVAALGYAWADRQMLTTERPERPFACAWLLSQACIAAVAALSGGPRSEALLWLAVPIVTVSARLTVRGLIGAVAATEVLLLAVTVGVDATAVLHAPQAVLYPAGAIAAVAVLSAALMNSDLHHRSKSVIDPLTQMLNRAALVGRAQELAEQSAVTGDPVAMIVLDLDHFKEVNDSHGHATGDAVLRDVAYLIRKELRAFDLAYRLGGEEFLVLLPGADIDECAEIAERLREAIAAAPAGGRPVTMSFGVASSGGGGFDHETVLCAADGALYAAKRGGRNRVVVSGALPDPFVPVP
jgi:diguanylate cyclase (GGDEF)-like protein